MDKTIKITDDQRAIIEMQQNVINLVVRVSCLEKLLIGKDKIIDEESYKKETEAALKVVSSIINDKLEEVNLLKKSDKKEE